MIDYPLALLYLIPDAKFSTKGYLPAYEDIIWQDERMQPTKEECNNAYPQAKYENDYKDVEYKRKKRYERETDGIFFDAMRADQDLTEWTAAVEVIKSELPYPAAPNEA